MNSIISLHRLIELLAKASGKDRDLCEKFIRVFSSEVGEALGAGGIVKIKGFGQFKVVKADGHQRIVYVPDREMADAINAPFACFEPVELAPGLSEDVFASVEDDPALAAYPKPINAPADEMPADTATDALPESNDRPAQLSLDFVSGVHSDELEQPAAPPHEDLLPAEEDAAEEDAAAVEEDAAFDDAAAVELQPEEILSEETAEEISGDDNLTDDESMDDTESGELPAVDDSGDTSTSDNSTTADPSDEIPANVVPVNDVSEYETPADETPADVQTSETVVAEQAHGEDPSESDASDPSEAEVSYSRFPWFWIAIAYIGGMAIGFALGFFGHDTLTGRSSATGGDEDPIDLADPSYQEPSEETALSAEVDSLFLEGGEVLASEEADSLASDTVATQTFPAAADSIPAPEAPKEPVFEKITPKVTLNSLALKYYGNKVYWVYIFLDNQDKIKNPNNVMVGTKLRIPPKEQYDVSPTDEKANIEAALRKQSEIYRKYGVR